jgi:hypothetical protein
MKSLASILFIILFCFSCSEPELVLDNELDPDNPDFLPPETTILYTNPALVDGVLNENSLTVYWEGNDPNVDFEFQYKLDDGVWSEWSSVPFGTLNYLDEGNHTALVQSRYPSGTVEDWPDTLNFEVDAIDGSSLRIHHLYTEAAVSDIFTVDIMAEEVVALSGAGITISFPSDGLSLDTLTPGPFFSQYPSQILYFYSESQSAGFTDLQLDIATLDQENDYFSGTGVIAVLEFRADAAGDYDIKFDGITTTLRNANNAVIPYEELIDGTVNIE